MVMLAFTNTTLHTLSIPSTFSPRASFKPLHLPTSSSCSFSGHTACWKARGITVITRAGASANSYLLAFAVPFSLLVITVLTAWRIGDKLDQDFLDELALNEAIREAEEEEEDEDDEYFDDFDEEDEAELEREPQPEPEIAFSRTRSRPRRET